MPELWSEAARAEDRRVRTGGGEVVEDMGELEGAVADGDGGGGGVVVLVVLLRRLRRALGGGLALPGRVALDDFGPGFTCQGRQRRAACRSVKRIVSCY